MDAAIDGRQQVLFPREPPHLPGAEGAEQGDAHQRDQGRREQGTQATRPHGSKRPCSALLTYCSATRMPFQRTDQEDAEGNPYREKDRVDPPGRLVGDLHDHAGQKDQTAADERGEERGTVTGVGERVVEAASLAGGREVEETVEHPALAAARTPTGHAVQPRRLRGEASVRRRGLGRQGGWRGWRDIGHPAKSPTNRCGKRTKATPARRGRRAFAARTPAGQLRP